MKIFKQARDLQIFAWALSLLVAGLAIFDWGHDNGWQIWHFNSYQFFPVLGLVAWSLMWSHYVMSLVREVAGQPKEVLQKWFTWTGYVVLVAICLHPGILIYQRFRDGFGLPPHSYETYVAHGLGWVTLLGTASLLVFLAFELRRFYGNKSWWPYAANASDFAMLAIFYHSIRLGSQLRIMGWFYDVWWFYGLTLGVIIVRKYILMIESRSAKAK